MAGTVPVLSASGPDQPRTASQTPPTPPPCSHGDRASFKTQVVRPAVQETIAIAKRVFSQFPGGGPRRAVGATGRSARLGQRRRWQGQARGLCREPLRAGHGGQLGTGLSENFRGHPRCLMPGSG